jgi:hypothetical protein
MSCLELQAANVGAEVIDDTFEGTTGVIFRPSMF